MIPRKSKSSCVRKALRRWGEFRKINHNIFPLKMCVNQYPCGALKKKFNLTSVNLPEKKKIS